MSATSKSKLKQFLTAGPEHQTPETLNIRTQKVINEATKIEQKVQQTTFGVISKQKFKLIELPKRPENVDEKSIENSNIVPGDLSPSATDKTPSSLEDHPSQRFDENGNPLPPHTKDSTVSETNVKTPLNDQDLESALRHEQSKVDDQAEAIREKKILAAQLQELKDKEKEMEDLIEQQKAQAAEELQKANELKELRLIEEQKLKEAKEREKTEADALEVKRLEELKQKELELEQEQIRAEQEKARMIEIQEQERKQAILDQIEREKQEKEDKQRLEDEKAKQAEEAAILERKKQEQLKQDKIEAENQLKLQQEADELVKQEILKQEQIKLAQDEALEQARLKQIADDEAAEKDKEPSANLNPDASKSDLINSIQGIVGDDLLKEMRVKTKLEEETIGKDYRSIEITYDIREVVRKISEDSDFKEERDGDFYAAFKEVLQTVDSILKKFLKVEIEEDRDPLKISKMKRTDIKSFQGRDMKALIRSIDSSSGQNIFSSDMMTDFYILAEVTKADNDILATAGPFGIISKTSRAVCGHLLVNLNNLKIPADNALQKYSNVMTIVHELFHALAFNAGIYEDLAKDLANTDTKKTIDDAFKGKKFNMKLNYTKLQDQDTFFYLNQLRHVKDKDNLLIDEEHWNPTYLPNDLMVPIERYDTVLSIFSLEYIEYIAYGWSVKTNRKNLQSNFLMDEISDYEHFFTYQCGDEEVSPYSSFCSAKEKMSQNRGCNSSYLMKTKCDRSEWLDNKCFENKALKNENCLSMDGSAGATIYPIETRGYQSRCVPGHEPFRAGGKLGMKTAYCLEVKFNKNDVIFVSPTGQTVVCTEGLDRVDMVIKEGSGDKVYPILCPETKQFKSKYMRTACPELCHGNGFCSDGICSCFDGFDHETNCKEKVLVNFSATNIFE